MDAVQGYITKAENGDYASIVYLSYSFLKGSDGFPKDSDQAFFWATRANEADPSDAYIMNLLGYCYEKGVGIKQDQVKSFEWYFKSAKTGNAYGLFALGNRYEERIHDWNQASEYYAAAAKAGETLAWFYLGYLYERGGGSVKSEDGEVNYLMIELELDPVITNGVKCCRRKLSEKGPVLKQDLAKAFLCYEEFDRLVTNKDLEGVFQSLKDDETGDEAIFLALIHQKGLGVHQDHGKAYQYYKLASKKSKKGDEMFTNFYDPDFYHRVIKGYAPLSKEVIEIFENIKI